MVTTTTQAMVAVSVRRSVIASAVAWDVENSRDAGLGPGGQARGELPTEKRWDIDAVWMMNPPGGGSPSVDAASTIDLIAAVIDTIDRLLMRSIEEEYGLREESSMNAPSMCVERSHHHYGRRLYVISRWLFGEIRHACRPAGRAELQQHDGAQEYRYGADRDRTPTYGEG